MEGGGEERSRPIAKRRDGVCRRVSSVPRGAPVPPPARRSSAVPAPLAAPRGRRVPLSPRVPGSVPSTPGCRASASPPPPAAASLTPASAGGQGSAGPAVSPAADLRPCILGKGVGGGWGGCVRSPPLASLPPGPFPSLFATPFPAGPRGARGGPHLSRPSARSGGLGGHSTPRQNGSEKPRRPRWEGGRDWPGVPSGEEGEGSRGRRAESEVQAWGSWTRARGEAGNPRPGGHSPFPAQRGQGSTFRRCPRLPPEHGTGWGCGTPGGGTGASRPPQVPTGPRPGLPALLHRHHHLPTTPRQ